MAMFELQPTLRVDGVGLLGIIAIPVALFVVHALCPLPVRKPLLLAATTALLYGLLGPTATGFVIGGGLLLIGLCHLPLAYRWRLLAVCAVAIVLALIQGRVIGGSRLLLIALPMIGALFMFRLMIYLYDIRHEKPGDASIVDRISYFFLLPAPLFPFFPTLDYNAYLRCYYARPAFEIYQTGVLWLSRGIVHLVLYRLIYHFYSPPTMEVVDLGGVLVFCFSGYMIYLRVSGVFHVIGGLIRLFGYDIPETHRLYFFATGFNDYWRRINIYWKDFMAKLFFFPTHTWARRTKLGTKMQLVVAIFVVFAATTILHAYQTFWLRGEFAIHETDWWFWGILGVLVVIGTLREHSKPGSPPNHGWSWKEAVVKSVQATWMFVLFCVLWALWSSQSLLGFFDVMANALNAKAVHVAALLGFIAAAVGLGTLGQWIVSKGFDPFVERPRPLRSMLNTALPLLLLAGLWQYHDAFALPGNVGRKFEIVRKDQPNRRDRLAEERSYYEVLMASGREEREAAEADEFIKERVQDIRGALYWKSYGPEELWGAMWSTNRWRMRDQLYSKRNTSGGTRYLITGASYVMGRGVGDGETFEAIAEEELNSKGQKVQLLNFAMSATCTVQRVKDFEERIVEFDGDYALLFTHRDEGHRNIRKIAQLIRLNHDVSYPILEKIVADEGITPDQSEDDIMRKLAPYQDQIMSFIYERFASVAKANNITPVWVYLPMITSIGRIDFADEGRAYAQAAGIKTVELHGVFGDHTVEELQVSETDQHPNQLGHRLIAKRLIQVLEDLK